MADEKEDENKPKNLNPKSRIRVRTVAPDNAEQKRSFQHSNSYNKQTRVQHNRFDDFESQNLRAPNFHNRNNFQMYGQRAPHARNHFAGSHHVKYSHPASSNDCYMGNSSARSSNEKNPHKKYESRGFGYKKLVSILESNSSNDLLLTLNKEISQFNALLNGDLKDDIIVLIVEILAKLCSSVFEANIMRIISIVCKSKFIKTLERYFLELPHVRLSSKNFNQHFWSDVEKFWLNVIAFCEAIIHLSPSTACASFPIMLDVAKLSIEGLQKKQLEKFTPEFLKKFDDIQIKFAVCVESVESDLASRTKQTEQVAKSEESPPDDFRVLPILPTVMDLVGHQRPFLRPNIVDGSYASVDHYLDVHFRLMREDYIAPMREGIKEYLKDSTQKKYSNIRVHKQTLILRYAIKGEVIGLLVQFGGKKKANPRANSKRFLYGSLLCFTKDNFENIFFATVIDRQDLGDGQVTVTVEEGLDIGQLLGKSYLMIESQVYFMPYFHILKHLQNPNLIDSFPMRKYIINVQNSDAPPAYLNETTIYKIHKNKFNTDSGSDSNSDSSSEESNRNDFDGFDKRMIKIGPTWEIRVLGQASWPEAYRMGLDESQYTAFRMALIKEFVTIQGPPGTGKTYVGLKVAQTILTNYSQKAPMLVVCFTNHALDQFLEGLLDVTDKLVRIGGQSKNTNLDRYNIRMLRRNYRRLYDADFFETIKRMNETDKVLKQLQNNTGIFDIFNFNNHFRIFLEPFNVDNARSCLVNWLLARGSIESLKKRLSKYPFLSRIHPKCRSKFNSEDEIEDVHRQQLEMDMDIDEENIDCFNIESLERELEYIEAYLLVPEEKKNFQVYQYELMNINNDIQYLNYRLERGHAGYPRVEFDHKTAAENYTPEQRWALYWQLTHTLHTRLQSEMLNNVANFQNKFAEHEELQMMNDYKILKNADVIGITTTGAARLQKLLLTIDAPIVIVEEAAEVMESHIIASLTKNCQHLIMIGDHQQLRPVTATYRLSQKFNLDISLFERMVKNGSHCYQLGVQHRMRPDIAALISPSIYPNLKNHISVTKYPDVLGVSKNVYFLDHDRPETFVEDINSRQNTHEANFLVAFAKYLVQQGYDPAEITILSTYSGQMFSLKEIKKTEPLVANVRISVLDNYQGEENKIILLSLVRSNLEAKVGFLSIPNRVCVALSRAKEGFYLIGNMSNLVKSGDLWKAVNATLIKQNAISHELTLQCQIHQNNFTKVKTHEDFYAVAEGGCLEKCLSLMGCGHYCKKICHVVDRAHENSICMDACTRRVCDLEHPCPLYCSKKCEPCKFIVERSLLCGHKMNLECHKDPKNEKCMVSVRAVLPLCNHENEKYCFMEMDKVSCIFPCVDRLPCGHACTKNCHKNSDPEHLDFVCYAPCPKKNMSCSDNHLCTKRCHEVCDECSIQVKKKRTNCSHIMTVPCSKDIDKIPCKAKCTKSMLCGHFCLNLCFEPCTSCRVMVKKLRSCGHDVMVPCSVDPDIFGCTGKCNLMLPCGHACPGQCSKPCDVSKCMQKVDNPFDSLCHHKFKIPCSLTKLEKNTMSSLMVMKYCSEPCKTILLGCQHACAGTCGQCLGGRLHAVCSEPCDNPLVCGHICKSPCREVCPPCPKPCEMRCLHSKCPLECGVPCNTCNEKCLRKCIHGKCSKLCGDKCDWKPCSKPCELLLEKCGHLCSGLCGEECPPVCSACGLLPEMLFGSEDDDGARFVKLIDCPHSVEVESLDKWVHNRDTNEGGGGNKEISMPKCPYCSASIVNTPRYMEYVKKMQNEIILAKTKVFGIKKDIVKQFSDLKDSSVSLISQNTHMVKVAKWMKLSRSICTEVQKVIKLTSQKRRLKYSSLDAKRIGVQIDVLNNLAQVCKIQETIKSSLILFQMECILNAVEHCSKSVSAQRSHDLNSELSRFEKLVYFVHVIEKSGNYNYLKKENQNILKFDSLLMQCILMTSTFDKKTCKIAEDYLSALEKEIGVTGSVSKVEIKRIVEAIGLKQGHWFLCENGHPYCIADCGGAMIRSKCNECGAVIGGENHSLVTGNRLATNIDGATRSAWPGSYMQ